jgi:hypothetical protein
MKEYPQNLKGIFMTIPLDITPEILAIVGAGDVVVNLNHHNPRTLVFEKKKSDGGGIVTFNTGAKTVTFKIDGTDFSRLGQHDIQIFFTDGTYLIPTYRGSFKIVANNVRS